jgi:uncharacterized membrane protein
MIALVMPQGAVMQFASGWHVENGVLWIVILVLFILLLVAGYVIVRTKWGHAGSPRRRHDASGPP